MTSHFWEKYGGVHTRMTELVFYLAIFVYICVTTGRGGVKNSRK